MIYSIYKITNKVNNKVYVGFTQLGIERWKHHLGNINLYRPLYNSMRKHGKNNFEFEIIYESKDHKHTLLEMEPHFIREYNSYNKGYNCNEGGMNGLNTAELTASNRKRMIENNPMKKLRTNRGTYKKGHVPTINAERNEKVRQSKLGDKNINFGNPAAAKPLNVKVTCEHCGTSMNKGNFHRWHKKKCSYLFSA